MAAMIIVAGGVVVLPILAFITSFLFWPGMLLHAYNRYQRLRLGMVVRYAHCEGYRFCYSSRGTPGGVTPSLLLLHGFTAHKDMWMSVIRYFPRDQHVVCVDMPGHEGTSRTGAEDYSIQGQVRRIHQFVQSIGLDKRPFHLLGSSMGGNVAGVYAARYPSHLSGLTLMCPAGLVYPTETKFVCHLRELKRNQQDESMPLIPSTLQELEKLLTFSIYTPPNLPRQVLKGILDNRIPNNHFYKQVFKEITGDKSCHSLQESLHLITAPVQVIWGKEDELLHVSGAEVLQAALPGCQVDLLDNCGHSVTLEQPRKTAKLIIDFLSAQEVVSENTKKVS